jgi:hypothetical protein
VRFKLRHTAALALLGWYLLAPALNVDGKVDVEMPFRKWTQLATFDTAPACQKALFTFQDAREQKPTTDTEWKEAKDAALRNGKQPPLDRKEMDKVFSELRCIASDDPRLKRE